MDVINENLRKVCSHTRNITYDWCGLFEGTKDAANASSTFELNFCKINYPIVFSRSKFTIFDISGLLHIS